MKSATGILAALVLTLVAVVPAGAQEATLLTPCEGAENVITVGSGTQTIDTPMVPTESTTKTFVLDLAGRAVGTTATVGVDLQWGDPSDYDLTVNGSSSASFNPTDGDGEFVSLAKVRHCQSITVDVLNFAGNPFADMTLDFSFSKVTAS